MKNDIDQPLQCFMCGKSQAETTNLLGGLLGYICEPCVVMASDVLENSANMPHGPHELSNNEQKLMQQLTPGELETLRERFEVVSS